MPSADRVPEDAGPAKSALGAVLANVTQQALSDECAAGGVDIELGVDANADGPLSSDEVARVVTVCYGAAGAAALADVDTLQAGEACPAGGGRVRTGLDSNGALDEKVVFRSEQLCNGAAGANGLTTVVVVKETESDEASPAGGVRISAGLDADADGELGNGEAT